MQKEGQRETVRPTGSLSQAFFTQASVSEPILVAGNAGSNPAEGMDLMFVSYICCVLCRQ
jgi:hypothetical protein